MRTLLINPGIHDFAAYDLWNRPLGLVRVGGLLRAWGWETELLDFLDRSHPALAEIPPGTRGRDDPYGCGKYVREEIPLPRALSNFPRRYFRYGLPPHLAGNDLAGREKPDLILVGSGMTYWYSAVRETVELARTAFPGVPLILGGTYARLLPGHALRECRPDLVQEGAGAGSLAASLEKLDFPAPRRPENGEAPPAWDLIGDRRALPVQLTRGCPFACPYCAAGRLEGKWRGGDPLETAREVLDLHEKWGTVDFAFYDNALLVGAENNLDPFLESLAGRGLRLHAPNSLHARLLRPITAVLMKEAGFITIRLSLETSQPDLQRRLGGKAGNADLKRAAGVLEKAGFDRSRVGVYTILGFPGQKPKQVEADISFVHSLGLQVVLAAFSPIPGTPVYGELEEEKRIPGDPLFTNNTVFPSLGREFPVPEIRRLRQLAAEKNRALAGNDEAV